MKSRTSWLGLVLLLELQSIPSRAQSIDDKIQDLQQKVENLEQRFAKDEPAQQPVSAATVANQGGFVLKSADGDFVARFGADLQVDNRTFLGRSTAPLMDQMVARRVRPTFSGTVYKYVDFYIRPDFGLGSAILYDAYVQLNYFERVNLRVGKFKPPVGLERLQADDDTSFIERAYPTLLVPSRDIGYQLSGDIVKHRASYQVGVFNGVPDNGLSDVSPSSHRDYAGRLFLTPFLPDSKSPLSGLGVGIGVSTGSVDGIALPAYKTFGQNSFFTFASGVTSAGHRTRLTPQAYYYLGPFGFLAEYALAEEGFQKGTVRHEIAFRAWQASVSYVLTGEKKSFTMPVPRNHKWGAVELALRVSDFNAEHAIYNYGFVNSTTTPRRAHEWIGGVNWYLNRMLRISLDYGNTNFGGGNRSSERAILQRFQIYF